MSSRSKQIKSQIEKIQLMRGGAQTTNLLSAFGLSLKETRLTAWLGYLLSMHPEPLIPLFGFSGTVLAIKLETNHEDGRSDILVETSDGIGIIEAKIGATDALAQARKYPARRYALLTSSRTNCNRPNIKNVSWQDLSDNLKTIRNHSPIYRFLVDEFNAHLEEHHMIKPAESLEIYAREINDRVTLDLFMKCGIYGCDYKKNNKISRAQYFAPHFAAGIAKEQPGIFVGISYVARVEHAFEAKTYNEFKDGVCEKRGKQWWNSHEEYAQKLRTHWAWDADSHRSYLLMGQPRLVFNPPIRKGKLQKGSGWLSRQFYSFDDLFAAWGN